MSQSVGPEIRARVDVALFTVATFDDVSKLAIVLTADPDGQPSIPGTAIEAAEGVSIEELSARVIAGIVTPTADRHLPEPLCWQTKTFRDADTNIVRIGYTAVANIETIAEGAVPIPVDELDQAAPLFTAAESTLMELGTSELRERLGDISLRGSPARARGNVFPVLARLLDPEAFTLPELRRVFDAALGGRDIRNLEKTIKKLAAADFIWTGEWRATEGRRAKIWKMSTNLIYPPHQNKNY